MVLSDLTITLSAFFSSLSLYMIYAMNLTLIWLVASPLFCLFIHRNVLSFTRKIKADMLYLFFVSTLVFLLGVWYIFTPLHATSPVVGVLVLLGSIPLFFDTKQAIAKELRA